MRGGVPPPSRRINNGLRPLWGHGPFPKDYRGVPPAKQAHGGLNTYNFNIICYNVFGTTFCEKAI